MKTKDESRAEADGVEVPGRLPEWFGPVLVLMAAAVGAAVAAAVLLFGTISFADQIADDFRRGLARAIMDCGTNVAGTESGVTDGMLAVSGHDNWGSYWRPIQTNSMGVLITTTGSDTNINQMDLSTTSQPVPATSAPGRLSLCVFNHDASIKIYCRIDSAATTLNGALILPESGRCFNADYNSAGAVKCIAASGTPRIDYVETIRRPE